ncbi:hypothetical protein COLO4_06027 [Corchorus olitorius]|uniref:Uncharacterized protein n=1 Tax=Corchorus olitorius TaxID=93759 RepID=A0A1R3KP99_9ROSI|nr:hypothetical protein COLO4_06027 [Corchorus olitorius]
MNEGCKRRQIPLVPYTFAPHLTPAKDDKKAVFAVVGFKSFKVLFVLSLSSWLCVRILEKKGSLVVDVGSPKLGFVLQFRVRLVPSFLGDFRA